ncbi:acyl-CoA dehydrogenase [Arenibacter sp. N53]|uniref:acyl-CoA dehydrogenase n=1 Tax=Arenibacter TaxID=178469 RepID=UPI000CD47CD3|nr:MULTISPECIES: acyl-CoA dehydrogenase [Arenibacter]MCM4151213.1 acyl-CoA dehydrogenase [Arenibacter sp. N53]
MIQVDKLQELRELCLGIEIFPKKVLDWIGEENLWSLWVPRTYGGLELSLTEGLDKLKELARIDASLGWTVTLCSGANYFIGNLKEFKARDIFLNSKVPVCLGGSGGVSGTAVICDDHYSISGKWRYATGAPYLTHFTLNAEIFENGNKFINDDGSPKVLSFVIPKDGVQIIEDWNAMGLKASATHSFEVKDLMVHNDCSFRYNENYLPHPIFKIPFGLFADLTLWVNYIGMAEHLLEEAAICGTNGKMTDLEGIVEVSGQKVTYYAAEIEKGLDDGMFFKKDYMELIHTEAANSVKNISREIIEIFPYLGVKASRKNHPLNQIFCDYFTATQHHIFTH